MTRKKLIEVALPLDDINRESAREKSIRHGHPSTLHLWWSRKPLATARAVLFASLVDDPSSQPERFPTLAAQEAERERLFNIIRELVKWENINNAAVLDAARAEIQRATNGNPPPVLDPFAGGGSIPLEAQRLGLEAHASDLNPVAVLINKALIEIPPRFANQLPIHPNGKGKMSVGDWPGATGLAEDVRFYGQWMRDQAQQRIGHLYPTVTLPKEHGGGEATVIAWLWARTVPCPNPACGAAMPLVNKWWLSSKKGKQAWVEPIIDHAVHSVSFTVRTGSGTPPDGTVNRRGATCIVCDAPVPFDHIRAEGRAGRMSAQLMAIVAEGNRQRVYLAPDEDHATIAQKAKPDWKPDADLPYNPRDFKTPNYGMRTFGDLFTDRQLVALTTFSDLVGEAREQVCRDALAAGMPTGAPLRDGGNGAHAYADAVAVYLGEAISKLTTFHNTMSYWRAKEGKSATGFGRQAIPMTWDFAEVNPFAGAGGDILEVVTKAAPKVIHTLASSTAKGFVEQQDATRYQRESQFIVSTDPPYYDNIGYADLSDFFYVWLRRSLHDVYPNLLSTLLVPKAAELVATPYRFDGDRNAARDFFEKGFQETFSALCPIQRDDYPMTVYYAFKQSEVEEDDEGSSTVSSTGWETMLEGMMSSGWTVTGTWPMRTEMATRQVAKNTNALASSILLVCRPRPQDAAMATRREFLAALRSELPEALRNLQHGNIAPVDLAQAAIGPGMAVFSRYRQVLESDGTIMPVRTALQLINKALDEVLAEQEGEYDSDTRWAIAWYAQYGTGTAAYGEAETLSKAKNTAVGGLSDAGIVQAQAGKVRLLRRDELPADWSPDTDRRVTVWETTQHLCRALERDGEGGAAALLHAVGMGRGEIARDLAYRLYTTAERKGWTQDALAYNSLVVAWPEIVKLTAQQANQPVQGRMV